MTTDRRPDLSGGLARGPAGFPSFVLGALLAESAGEAALSEQALLSRLAAFLVALAVWAVALFLRARGAGRREAERTVRALTDRRELVRRLAEATVRRERGQLESAEFQRLRRCLLGRLFEIDCAAAGSTFASASASASVAARMGDAGDGPAPT
ncbi:MAG: hypothetical protein HY719_01615 [Planctomycetes bacterium]|nr:hypothetical protein [Planctomycetota bacterium]